MNFSGLLSSILLIMIVVGCNVKAVDAEGNLISNHQNQKNEFTLVTSLNQNYLNGDTIVFILSFPRPVDVTGVPSFSIDVGGMTKTASYVSGTGTGQLRFEYVVSGPDLDSDGITASTSFNWDPSVSLIYDSKMTCGDNIRVPDLSTVKVNASP